MVDGILNSGDKVTLDRELYLSGQPRPKTNKDSYCAVVSGFLGGNMYHAKDTLGNVSIIDRSHLCLRQRHVVCRAHVSDDKKHDRWAMQHLSSAELEWLEEYMNRNFPQDIPEDKITHLHLHSDNAGSHLKKCRGR